MSLLSGLVEDDDAFQELPCRFCDATRGSEVAVASTRELPDESVEMKDGEATPPLSWQRDIFDKLDALREAWPDADAPPPGVGVLSSGEYVALAVACGFERVLRNPVVGFLLLDGWLQEWVMRHRGMAHLIGTQIGVDPSA